MKGVNLKKPTRNDVAALAGVSSATVSRVYNNPESVSEYKRTSVIQASEKLGYSPDKSASALRRKGTGKIALLDIKKDTAPYSWNSFPVFKWFYSDVIEGISKVINNSMFQLIIESLEDLSQINRLKNSCDGIILFDAGNPEAAEAVKNTGLPYVLSHHTVDFEGYNTCSTDNFYGGILQAEMLEKSGAKNPVYISGFTDQVFSHSERYRGFKTVYPDAPLVEEGIGVKAGRKAVSSILKSFLKGDIDSAAVVNDYTAAGVYYQISDSGLKVPEDIKIVSYDNMPFNSILPVPFSTIDLNPSQIYEKAASLLINKVMRGEAVSETVKPSPVAGNTAGNI